MKGLEPLLLSKPDPKSGASTNFATGALDTAKIGNLWKIQVFCVNKSGKKQENKVRKEKNGAFQRPLCEVGGEKVGSLCAVFSIALFVTNRKSAKKVNGRLRLCERWIVVFVGLLQWSQRL